MEPHRAVETNSRPIKGVASATDLQQKKEEKASMRIKPVRCLQTYSPRGTRNKAKRSFPLRFPLISFRNISVKTHSLRKRIELFPTKKMTSSFAFQAYTQIQTGNRIGLLYLNPDLSHGGPDFRKVPEMEKLEVSEKSVFGCRCYTEFCHPSKSVTPGGAVAYFLSLSRRQA